MLEHQCIIRDHPKSTPHKNMYLTMGEPILGAWWNWVYKACIFQHTQMLQWRMRDSGHKTSVSLFQIKCMIAGLRIRSWCWWSSSEEVLVITDSFRKSVSLIKCCQHIPIPHHTKQSSPSQNKQQTDRKKTGQKNDKVVRAELGIKPRVLAHAQINLWFLQSYGVPRKNKYCKQQTTIKASDWAHQ